MNLKCIECMDDIEVHTAKYDRYNRVIVRTKRAVTKDVRRKASRAKVAITVVGGRALCIDHIVEKAMNLEL